MKEIIKKPLTLKALSEILTAQFFIPHYQRGYRWTEHQVIDLLNDINSFSPKNIPGSDEKTFYCLQPVVVKPCAKDIKSKYGLSDSCYEVIDGQQRLTTIFLLIHYANEMWIGKQKSSEFDLQYETRTNSSSFLHQLQVDASSKVSIDNSNIDYYHISSAYDAINSWVMDFARVNLREFDNNEFQSKLKSHTKIIWYEVDNNSDSVELFTRLNIGKIPLTNAELIKALFLSSSSFENYTNEDAIRMKMEISQIWDEIEQKLSDEQFWSFATNAKQNNFSTKIELLFDMIANKKKNELEPLFTFFYFLEKSKDTLQPLWNLWLSIEQYYLTIYEWYKDKTLYHKVGYLITIDESIGSLIHLTMKEKKSDFKKILDDKIRSSVSFDIESLRYNKNGDYQKITNLLLLFNVESIRANNNISEYYPFKNHKNTFWSLEHIHAQNSESLDKTKKESWFKWLNYHKELIEELVPNEKDTSNNEGLVKLLDEINQFNNEKLTWEKFDMLSRAIIQRFSENSEDSDDRGLDESDSISNLALLSQPDNAALNNAVFEVKRRAIIRMDKEGNYIPLCTRRVFLKYYNEKPSTEQNYFWSKDDRFNYLNEIKKVLKEYLPTQKITIS